VAMLLLTDIETGEHTINDLTENIVRHMSSLYKCCESIALLDMVRYVASVIY
jgi:hypothetical protein